MRRAHILFVLVCAGRVRADVIAQSQGGVLEDALGSLVVAATGPTGTNDLFAKAKDSSGPGDSMSVGNLYKRRKSSKTRVVRDGGPRFIETAKAMMNWGPGFWNSRGSFARIVPGPGNRFYSPPETGLSIAFAVDPQYYSVTFDPGYLPEVDFSIMIPAGTNLVAESDGPGETSQALFSGTFTTSLMTDPLWTFAWTADSADPNSSEFLFTSNPSLGLNDAAITSQFEALVSDSLGIHTLTSSFSLDVALFPELSPGTNTLNYSFGGSTENEADAQYVPVDPTPEPGAAWLCGIGLLFLALSPRLLATQHRD